jgi:hypothetical protein
MGVGQSLEDRSEKKFWLGQRNLTPGATVALYESGVLPDEYFRRHQSGDWGEVSENDRAENEFSIGKELRIWSIYHLPVTGEKIWVITEADRSRTTILLPDEY